jgi:3-keto-disaccharide hydrolase
MRYCVVFLTLILLACSGGTPATETPAASEPSPTASATSIPEGFTSIFPDENLTGWHISKTNHHGTTPDWQVVDGILIGKQNPPGKGGIMLTDKKYKDFEVYIEIRPVFGCDGGLFLRSSEAGQAYQVMLDYLEGGSMGGIYGEKLEDVKGGRAENWEQHWKKDDWNSIRARIEGDVPHIQVWMNGAQIVDWTDTENHAADGATEGMIAVQLHYTTEGAEGRWVDGGEHRYRAIAVKEL